tara:strand:- start:2555 stop:2887 length:333 start_codon:yes stop_codon:yes gene_type:complete
MKRKDAYYVFPNPVGWAGELIKRRRLQMLVHSCLYYTLSENIWNDHEFDDKARELARLLEDHPHEYSDRFDEFFNGWDGSTGFHLPHRDPWVINAAQNLLRSKERIDVRV